MPVTVVIKLRYICSAHSIVVNRRYRRQWIFDTGSYVIPAVKLGNEGRYQPVAVAAVHGQDGLVYRLAAHVLALFAVILDHGWGNQHVMAAGGDRSDGFPRIAAHGILVVPHQYRGAHTMLCL